MIYNNEEFEVKYIDGNKITIFIDIIHYWNNKLFLIIFFLNLLSIVLVDKFYYFNKATRQELSVNDGWIGLSIETSGHAIGIFKCDDNDYKYVNNNFITNFNFNEFQKTHRRLSLRNNYTILCNDFDGIYIEQTEPLEYFYFCNKNDNIIDYNKSRENKFEIIDVEQIYEYKGDKNFFLKSNERIINLVSANYRLFKEMVLGKISKIKQLCDNNEINADFKYDTAYTLFETALGGFSGAVPIIISSIKEYDHALEVLCKNYSTYPNKKFIEENIKYIFEHANTKQIKIRILYTLLSRFEFLKKLYEEYLLTEPIPAFIIDKDRTNIQLLIASKPVQQERKQYIPPHLRNRPAPAPAPGLGAWSNKYLKYNISSERTDILGLKGSTFQTYVGSEAPNLDDIFYKKYIMYKQKYLNLKNKLSNL
jgi:hypothetical protein